MRRLTRIVMIAMAALALASCTPYANLDIGAPFKVGPVYFNPSIGIGGNL